MLFLVTSKWCSCWQKFQPFKVLWQYARHGRSPQSELLISVHSYLIVWWFLSSPTRAFHKLYINYINYITYITESGRKKNKQAWIWVSLKRKKGEVLAPFWHSVAITTVYPNEILTQQPGMLIHPLALFDLASGSTDPNSSPQQSPLSDRRLSLTVANSSLLLTALGPAFPRLLLIS